MPLNKKGGKGHKKCKNNINREQNNKKLEVKEEGEAYGIVNKILGSGRMTITYYDESIKNNVTVLGIVRGSIKKRTRFIIGDLILVSIRDFQKDKADVIYKYDFNEITKLKKRNEIPSSILSCISSSSENNEIKFVAEDEDNFEIQPQENRIEFTTYEDFYDSLSFNKSEDIEENEDPIDLI